MSDQFIWLGHLGNSAKISHYFVALIRQYARGRASTATLKHYGI